MRTETPTEALRARVALLEQALRPFAEAGALFLPADKSDRSSFLDVPDGDPIGNRLVWRTTPLTIGDLRRAASAIMAEETAEETREQAVEACVRVMQKIVRDAGDQYARKVVNAILAGDRGYREELTAAVLTEARRHSVLADSPALRGVR